MTMRSSTPIPVESYGVLFQEKHESELDEIAEKVRRLGYAILESGYSVKELNQLSEAFNLSRTNYVQAYGEMRLRSTKEFHTIRAPLTYGDPVFVELATNQNHLTVLAKLNEG